MCGAPPSRPPASASDARTACTPFATSTRPCFWTRGESIKALSEYLGHPDPSFTLRTYTHLMPNSEARPRAAVDRVFRDPDSTEDGPETAQGES
jgi:hypothetical protein